jgi:DNA mismatch repair protein MutL
MHDIIQQLPDSIANQIAAGEVVQRPASVVKELLENAVDAGAQSIKLIVRDAGKALIQVVDDGCGMSETDARMSFERHATSKIRTAEDLFKIRTMGFRGEALASIAAVAQVELKTRKSQEEMGTCIIVHGSRVEDQSYCQTAKGTSVQVRNLFYNTPGRRKFLKSDSVEFRHIRDEFINMALAHPELELNFYKGDQLLYQLNPGNLRNRVVAILGEENNKRIIPVDETSSSVKIRGFVGKPEFARKSRKEQYLFVNQRYVKNFYITHAITTAYKDLIEEGRHPFFVLFLSLDPASIDINVHPTKHEVKFEDERLVYQIIHVAIKHALGKHNVIPSLDFEQDNRFLQFTSDKAGKRELESGNPSRNENNNRQNEMDNLANWKKLYEGLHSTEHDSQNQQGEKSQELNPDLSVEVPQRSKCFQLHNQYILAQTASGLVILDQQAAHERVLYEHILKLKSKGEISSQRLLFPSLIELGSKYAQDLREILDEVNALGFDIQDFGNDSFVVHAQPAYSNMQIDAEQCIMELLEQKDLEIDLKLELTDRLARQIALNASVKSGQSLSEEEMHDLIDQLFACDQPNYGLRKQKTFKILNIHEVEDWLK